MIPDTGNALEGAAGGRPQSAAMPRELLSAVPAGAGVLVAVAGLALRVRARWQRYLQIGLWLLALASSVYLTETFAPFTGVWPLYEPIIAEGVSVVAAVALLTVSLRRPAGRQLRWHWVFVLLAQDQAGKIVASQSLPLRTSGARYRMRLPAGTYSINVSTASSGLSDDWEYVPADGADELDFNDSGGCAW